MRAARFMTPEASASAAPAGQLVVERPPEGLARGTVPFPAWAIALTGVVVIAVALGILWRRRAGRRA
jgi:hypothetical protein